MLDFAPVLGFLRKKWGEGVHGDGMEPWRACPGRNFFNDRAKKKRRRGTWRHAPAMEKTSKFRVVMPAILKFASPFLVPVWRA